MKHNAIKKEMDSLTNEILDESWLKRIQKESIKSFGINDSKQIVLDYVDKREYGVAFEHLNYVISESNIKLTQEHKFRILKLADILNA